MAKLIKLKIKLRFGIVVWMPEMVRNEVLMQGVKEERSLLCLTPNLLLQIYEMLKNDVMLIQRGLHKT